MSEAETAHGLVKAGPAVLQLMKVFVHNSEDPRCAGLGFRVFGLADHND
jgi:hypothetical protein